MAQKLTKCKACGADIAKNAASCPQCGAKNKSLRNLWISLVSCVILAAALILSNALSLSGNQLTLDKFERVATGMTYEEVVDIIGFEGKLTADVDIGLGDQFKSQSYSWQNPDGSNMLAIFQGGILNSKSQAGLK